MYQAQLFERLNISVFIKPRTIGRGGGGGGGSRWVRPHPLMRRKGPLNLSGRVKMTLRMQEM